MERAQSGIGLINVRKRLEMIYPGRYSLETKQHDTYLSILNLNLINEVPDKMLWRKLFFHLAYAEECDEAAINGNYFNMITQAFYVDHFFNQHLYEFAVALDVKERRFRPGKLCSCYA